MFKSTAQSTIKGMSSHAMGVVVYVESSSSFKGCDIHTSYFGWNARCNAVSVLFR